MMCVPKFLLSRRLASAIDPWAAALFLVHLIAALAFIPHFPGQVQDPDLLAYFVWFRSWVGGGTELEGASYFNHPKLILILLLGPLGSVNAAAVVTACAAGALGCVVYLVGCRAFGQPAGLLWSVLLLGDPSRIFLSLKSGADLYLTLLLFLAIWLAMRSRLVAAAGSVFLAALVKPVAIPCALAFLLAPAGLARRAVCMVIPLLAIPLTLAFQASLTGGAMIPTHYLQEFSALREIPGIRPDDLPGFVFWNVLVENRFGALVGFGLAGLVIWIVRDPGRLRCPLFLMPALLFSGYLSLSVISPYLPFFRFFWILDVWVLGFIAYFALVAGRLLARRTWASVALVGVIVLLVLAQSRAGYLRYRDTFALPIERDRGLALAAAGELAHARAPHESVLCPLSFQPLLMWTQPSSLPGNLFWTAEGTARDRIDAKPDWIFDIPTSYISAPARQLVGALISSGSYQAEFTGDGGTLYRKKPSTPEGGPR